MWETRPVRHEHMGRPRSTDKSNKQIMHKFSDRKNREYKISALTDTEKDTNGLPA